MGVVIKADFSRTLMPKSMTEVQELLSKTYDYLRDGAITVEVARERTKAADRFMKAQRTKPRRTK